MIPNFMRKEKLIFTKNAVPGVAVYGERLTGPYREWDLYKSKLAVGLLKSKHISLDETDVVLYLGASTGTTVSHVSDIVSKGFVFAVEFAPRVCRELVFLAEQRRNIAPILADANQPQQYADAVCQADFLFQDVAQRNQAEIFLKNVALFLKPGGLALLALKARSVDVTKRPAVVYKAIEAQLSGVQILDKIPLEPYQRDHMLFVCRKRQG